MKCLTHEQIDALLCGTTSAQEQADWLEHVVDCDACAEALARRTAQLPCAAPPVGITSQVLAKTRAKPRQESLRNYTLRVVAAMAAALILLFSGAFQFLFELPEVLPEFGQNIQTAITEFFDFTQGGSPDAPETP